MRFTTQLVSGAMLAALASPVLAHSHAHHCSAHGHGKHHQCLKMPAPVGSNGSGRDGHTTIAAPMHGAPDRDGHTTIAPPPPPPAPPPPPEAMPAPPPPAVPDIGHNSVNSDGHTKQK